MPLNCPIATYIYPDALCSDCHYSNWGDDKCSWFFPPLPLSEILTYGERLDRMNEHIKSIEYLPIGKPVFRDEINRIKGEITHIHNEQHLQKSKPKKISKY